MSRASGPLVVVGDSLLDRDVEGSIDRLVPDAPAPVVDVRGDRTRPGGAALAAALAREHADAVVLVTALADDDHAATLRRLLEDAGVTVAALALRGTTPTKTRVCAGHHVVARLDQPVECGAIASATRAVAEALAGASAVLVSDYGRGLTARRDLRRLIGAIRPSVPVVWDPHPRGANPVRGTRLLTPNEREASTLTGGRPATAAARALLARHHLAGVAVTCGRRGALLVVPQGPPLVVPPPAVTPDGDTCGAGDAFAAAATVALRDRDVLGGAVERAVHAASEFVSSGGAGNWPRARGASAVAGRSAGSDLSSVVERARDVRARGGRVVATSGCFDLLHAGHVGMLRAARSLGDHLVVLLNSDSSVRRLKGPSRPLQPASDRAELLAGLRMVDDVAVFDEDTPVGALRVLRPDVFVKGGDYAYRDLAEVEAMRSLGGEVVVVPYVSGRSTSGLIESATANMTES
jgi:rfaE bifunctional protein nucleotidyltransferase chain/domain/rfaE bifunctional protein kinase chain/domain